MSYMSSLILKSSILFAFLSLFYACNPTSSVEELDRKADEQYADIISAYTSGKIQSGDQIVISLAQEVAVQKQLTNGVLNISPSVKGELTWLDARTIAFKPSNRLENGRAYRVSLDLGTLGIDVTEELKDFEFAFEVIEQDYSLQIVGLSSAPENPMENQLLTGVLQTADYVSLDQLEGSLSAIHLGENLSVSWQYDATAGTQHDFVISGAKRQESTSQIAFEFNGDKIGVSRDLDGALEVPALNDFKLLDASVVKRGEPYLLLRFSDPLNESQDLSGLIELEGEDYLRFDIDNNEVKAYTSSALSGSKMLSVFAGIKNKLNYAMPKTFEQSVSFEQIPPAIKFQAEGTILPSTDGLLLPFSAVNLKAVDVTIIKIYEDNVLQFLQANNLGGDNELRRVGKPIHQSKVILDDAGIMNLSEWNQFKLDVSELVSTEPGAIYQVRLGFGIEDAVYICEGLAKEEVLGGQIEDNWAENGGEGQGTYDSYYSYNYGYGYSWSEQDNPCHVSYYMGRGKSVSTNILASDLGLIAKVGNDRKLVAFVTDLKTTAPLANVQVTAFNYQGEEIASDNTDREGKVSFELPTKPFVLMAERTAERAYLKLWDANALSISNFNVGGARLSRGLQGFIYAERGVWRPGDDIYLNFLLKDNEEVLPDDHPVILELIDPSGNRVLRKVETEGLNGFYHFPVKTTANAPTGNWLAKVIVGGKEYTKRIKIETVKPNRLRIDLDFGRDKILSSQRQVTGDLEVEWLSGAAARGLKAEFDLTLSPTITKFKGFENYSFDDDAKQYYSEKERVYTGVVNQQGKAKVNIALNQQANAPGALRATFSGKVFEPGGDFSIDQFSIPYYPYEQFVGLKKPDGDSRGQLLTNKSHQFDVVVLNDRGQQINNAEVQVDVFKLNWRWWWDNSAENLSYYVGRNYSAPYLTSKVRVKNGKGNVSFEIPNADWGRYYLRVTDLKSGHSAGEIAYFDWPGWAGKERPGGESLLDFATNKEQFSVGDDIQVRIPASTNGRALISIENGSKVVDAFWIETKEGQNEISFKATGDMVPNAYVSATLLQPHEQTANDLPMRLYGIIPIEVSDQSTILEPEILLPEVLEPETEVTIQVSEANDQPMTYTIAVVDEGLLDLTNFATPNPWTTFYARQALGVKTWDVYDDVIGSFKGQLSRLLAIGGDGSSQDPDNVKANRFESVVKHLGPFSLAAGQKAKHSFEMPNYVGSVRTMVVAGNKRAFGESQKATPVRKPVMVLGTLPRVLGPGEHIKLPVNVFVMEEGIESVEVSIKTNELLTSKGTSQATLRFDEVGDQIIDFDLEVAEDLGIAEVMIEARSGKEMATYKVEVDVRNANPVQHAVTEFSLKKGESLEEAFAPLGMAGTNLTTLELSSIPAIDLARRLDYLIAYPHGCIEQTTSAVFPQIFLSDLVDLNANQQLEVSQKVKAGIQKIADFQTGQGGFSYWPGQSDENDWGTSYAGHFLIEAKNKGYYVSGQLLNKWKSYQRKKARSWARGNYNDDLAQAYRLYTLALAQSPELGAMNRLREDVKLGVEAKWRLAAAYALTGRKTIAQELIEDLSLTAQIQNSYSYYGSLARNNALRLETLALLDQQENGIQLLRDLSTKLSANTWMSTQTTAYALLSVFKFVGAGEAGIDVNYAFAKVADEFKTAKSIKMIESDAQGQVAAKVTNRGEGMLFVRVIQKGQPMAGQEQADEKGLSLKVNYVDRNGEVISPTQLEQGQDFFAEVEIRNSGSTGLYQNLALTQVFPAGWEILNDRLNEISNSQVNKGIDYQDIRDDRVMTYFDLQAGERLRFKVALNATYAGDYYLPAVNVEAMYDETIYARTAGEWVSVLRAK